MARQRSIFKIQGQVGEFSFYKTVTDGFLVRRIGGVDAHQVKTDPRFARTRENSVEFGTAVRAARLLRTAFHTLILNSKDSRLSSRLTGALVKAIRADKTNAQGERNLTDGDVQLLTGFEINNEAKLQRVFSVPYTPTIDKSTGECQIEFGEHTSPEMILTPSGATHYRLMMGAALLDFQNATHRSNIDRSEAILLQSEPTLPITLRTNVPPNGTGQFFQVLGIEFLQYVNGNYYVMNNGVCNALAIVKISS